MNDKHHIWRIWARHLHNWGLNSLAAWLLEASAPLHILAAQLVYIGQPLLGLVWAQEHARSLAEALEQPPAARELAQVLREGYAP